MLDNFIVHFYVRVQKQYDMMKERQDLNIY